MRRQPAHEGHWCCWGRGHSPGRRHPHRRPVCQARRASRPPRPPCACSRSSPPWGCRPAHTCLGLGKAKGKAEILVRFGPRLASAEHGQGQKHTNWVCGGKEPLEQPPLRGSVPLPSQGEGMFSTKLLHLWSSSLRKSQNKEKTRHRKGSISALSTLTQVLSGTL